MIDSILPSPARRILCGACGAVAIGALILTSPALAEDVSALAARLSGLRGEVETLSGELSEETQALQDQLRSLARQKSELEIELQRERARLQKARLSVAERQEEIADEKAAGDELKPLFDKYLAAVRKHVQTSLPFRTDERLAELNKIEEQVTSKLLTPERAVLRLWTFVEDEFRMTRENGLFRQTITLDGQEQLADVVRLGTVAMYFRTSDDRVGFVTKSGAGWDYRETGDKDEKRRITNLFDSFKKQIRVGYFELPNALPVGQ